MRYIRKDDIRRAQAHGLDLDLCGSIDRTGSVRGMQTRFGWQKGGQVRVGGYIYNPGTVIVERLRNAGLIRG